MGTGETAPRNISPGRYRLMFALQALVDNGGRQMYIFHVEFIHVEYD
jgi:hypothetical protein